MFRKKSLSDELFLHCSAKVQNLTVFSFIYMIRIRFFGPGELIQKGFRAAQYMHHLAAAWFLGESQLAWLNPAYTPRFVTMQGLRCVVLFSVNATGEL